MSGWALAWIAAAAWIAVSLLIAAGYHLVKRRYVSRHGRPR